MYLVNHVAPSPRKEFFLPHRSVWLNLGVANLATILVNEPNTHHQQHNLGSPILSMSVNDSIGCGVAATLHGGIVLFSLQDGKKRKLSEHLVNSTSGKLVMPSPGHIVLR